MKEPTLTIGIEEEYQIIDPETRELRSYITEILQEDSIVLGEVKPELHQSMVEVGTRVRIQGIDSISSASMPAGPSLSPVP